MIPQPKVIETEYAGVRFRSRLEARWAVFFDQLDVPWEYESESFRLRSGAYMPDFRLGDFCGGPVWFEVKPPDAPADHRWFYLAEFTGRPVYVARGMPKVIGDHIEWTSWNGILAVHDDEFSCDGYEFCRCPMCFRIGIELYGNGADVCARRCCDGDEEIYTYRNPLFVTAYKVALSTRFGT